jgi:hypothetical protein
MAVLALYLAAILLVQALAAAWVLGAGPLHQHRRQGLAAGSPVASLASVAFSHRELELQVAHAQAHATGLRHHHAAHDPDVLLQDPAAEAADAAAVALAAALALLAWDAPRAQQDTRQHVWRDHAPWAVRTAWTPLQFKPPRLG